MAVFLARNRTPVFKDQLDHGEGWGAGSFIEIDGSRYILTNEHVAVARNPDQQLGFQLADQGELFIGQGNHVLAARSRMRNCDDDYLGAPEST
jgi:S1-C subfamily serine protease